MAYVRINMAEVESREEMQRTIEPLQKNMKSIFPEMRLFIAVETSETSMLGVSVYDDKDAADRAVANRTKHLEDKEIKDNFTFEGLVSCFYTDREQLENLLKTYS